MSKQMDDDLNLLQLLTRCKQLDPATMIHLYFDPDIFCFYIRYVGEMDFFLSPDASFIGDCRADGVRLCIEIIIANAVRKIIEPDE